MTSNAKPDSQWVHSVGIDWDALDKPDFYAECIARCATSMTDFRDRYVYPKKRLLFLSRVASCGVSLKMATFISNEFYKASESELKSSGLLSDKGYEEAIANGMQYDKQHPLAFLPKEKAQPQPIKLSVSRVTSVPGSVSGAPKPRANIISISGLSVKERAKLYGATGQVLKPITGTRTGARWVKKDGRWVRVMSGKFRSIVAIVGAGTGRGSGQVVGVEQGGAAGRGVGRGRGAPTPLKTEPIQYEEVEDDDSRRVKRTIRVGAARARRGGRMDKGRIEMSEKQNEEEEIEPSDNILKFARRRPRLRRGPQQGSADSSASASAAGGEAGLNGDIYADEEPIFEPKEIIPPRPPTPPSPPPTIVAQPLPPEIEAVLKAVEEADKATASSSSSPSLSASSASPVLSSGSSASPSLSPSTGDGLVSRRIAINNGKKMLMRKEDDPKRRFPGPMGKYEGEWGEYIPGEEKLAEGQEIDVTINAQYKPMKVLGSKGGTILLEKNEEADEKEHSTQAKLIRQGGVPDHPAHWSECAPGDTTAEERVVTISKGRKMIKRKDGDPKKKPFGEKGIFEGEYGGYIVGEETMEEGKDYIVSIPRGYEECEHVGGKKMFRFLPTQKKSAGGESPSVTPSSVPSSPSIKLPSAEEIQKAKAMKEEREKLLEREKEKAEMFKKKTSEYETKMEEYKKEVENEEKRYAQYEAELAQWEEEEEERKSRWSESARSYQHTPQMKDVPLPSPPVLKEGTAEERIVVIKNGAKMLKRKEDDPKRNDQTLSPNEREFEGEYLDFIEKEDTFEEGKEYPVLLPAHLSSEPAAGGKTVLRPNPLEKERLMRFMQESEQHKLLISSPELQKARQTQILKQRQKEMQLARQKMLYSYSPLVPLTPMTPLSPTTPRTPFPVPFPPTPSTQTETRTISVVGGKKMLKRRLNDAKRRDTKLSAEEREYEGKITDFIFGEDKFEEGKSYQVTAPKSSYKKTGLDGKTVVVFRRPLCVVGMEEEAAKGEMKLTDAVNKKMASPSTSPSMKAQNQAGKEAKGTQETKSSVSLFSLVPAKSASKTSDSSIDVQKSPNLPPSLTILTSAPQQQQQSSDVFMSPSLSSVPSTPSSAQMEFAAVPEKRMIVVVDGKKMLKSKEGGISQENNAEEKKENKFEGEYIEYIEGEEKFKEGREYPVMIKPDYSTMSGIGGATVIIHPPQSQPHTPFDHPADVSSTPAVTPHGKYSPSLSSCKSQARSVQKELEKKGAKTPKEEDRKIVIVNGEKMLKRRENDPKRHDNSLSAEEKQYEGKFVEYIDGEEKFKEGKEYKIKMDERQYEIHKGANNVNIIQKKPKDPGFWKNLWGAAKGVVGVCKLVKDETVQALRRRYEGGSSSSASASASESKGVKPSAYPQVLNTPLPSDMKEGSDYRNVELSESGAKLLKRKDDDPMLLDQSASEHEKQYVGEVTGYIEGEEMFEKGKTYPVNIRDQDMQLRKSVGNKTVITIDRKADDHLMEVIGNGAADDFLASQFLSSLGKDDWETSPVNDEYMDDDASAVSNENADEGEVDERKELGLKTSQIRYPPEERTLIVMNGKKMLLSKAANVDEIKASKSDISKYVEGEYVDHIEGEESMEEGKTYTVVISPSDMEKKVGVGGKVIFTATPEALKREEALKQKNLLKAQQIQEQAIVNAQQRDTTLLKEKRTIVVQDGKKYLKRRENDPVLNDSSLNLTEKEQKFEGVYIEPILNEDKMTEGNEYEVYIPVEYAQKTGVGGQKVIQTKEVQIDETIQPHASALSGKSEPAAVVPFAEELRTIVIQNGKKMLVKSDQQKQAAVSDSARFEGEIVDYIEGEGCFAEGAEYKVLMKNDYFPVKRVQTDANGKQEEVVALTRRCPQVAQEIVSKDQSDAENASASGSSASNQPEASSSSSAVAFVDVSQILDASKAASTPVINAASKAAASAVSVQPSPSVSNCVVAEPRTIVIKNGQKMLRRRENDQLRNDKTLSEDEREFEGAVIEVLCGEHLLKEGRSYEVMVDPTYEIVKGLNNKPVIFGASSVSAAVLAASESVRPQSSTSTPFSSPSLIDQSPLLKDILESTEERTIVICNGKKMLKRKEGDAEAESPKLSEEQKLYEGELVDYVPGECSFEEGKEYQVSLSVKCRQAQGVEGARIVTQEASHDDGTYSLPLSSVSSGSDSQARSNQGQGKQTSRSGGLFRRSQSPLPFEALGTSPSLSKRSSQMSPALTSSFSRSLSQRPRSTSVAPRTIGWKQRDKQRFVPSIRVAPETRVVKVVDGKKMLAKKDITPEEAAKIQTAEDSTKVFEGEYVNAIEGEENFESGKQYEIVVDPAFLPAKGIAGSTVLVYDIPSEPLPEEEKEERTIVVRNSKKFLKRKSDDPKRLDASLSADEREFEGEVEEYLPGEEKFEEGKEYNVLFDPFYQVGCGVEKKTVVREYSMDEVDLLLMEQIEDTESLEDKQKAKRRRMLAAKRKRMKDNQLYIQRYRARSKAAIAENAIKRREAILQSSNRTPTICVEPEMREIVVLDGKKMLRRQENDAKKHDQSLTEEEREFEGEYVEVIDGENKFREGMSYQVMVDPLYQSSVGVGGKTILHGDVIRLEKREHPPKTDDAIAKSEANATTSSSASDIVLNIDEVEERHIAIKNGKKMLINSNEDAFAGKAGGAVAVAVLDDHIEGELIDYVDGENTFEEGKVYPVTMKKNYEKREGIDKKILITQATTSRKDIEASPSQRSTQDTSSVTFGINTVLPETRTILIRNGRKMLERKADDPLRSLPGNEGLFEGEFITAIPGESTFVEGKEYQVQIVPTYDVAKGMGGKTIIKQKSSSSTNTPLIAIGEKTKDGSVKPIESLTQARKEQMQRSKESPSLSSGSSIKEGKEYNEDNLQTELRIIFISKGRKMLRRKEDDPLLHDMSLDEEEREFEGELGDYIDGEDMFEEGKEYQLEFSMDYDEVEGVDDKRILTTDVLPDYGMFIPEAPPLPEEEEFIYSDSPPGEEGVDYRAIVFKNGKKWLRRVPNDPARNDETLSEDEREFEGEYPFEIDDEESLQDGDIAFVEIGEPEEYEEFEEEEMEEPEAEEVVEEAQESKEDEGEAAPEHKRNRRVVRKRETSSSFDDGMDAAEMATSGEIKSVSRESSEDEEYQNMLEMEVLQMKEKQQEEMAKLGFSFDLSVVSNFAFDEREEKITFHSYNVSKKLFEHIEHSATLLSNQLGESENLELRKLVLKDPVNSAPSNWIVQGPFKTVQQIQKYLCAAKTHSMIASLASNFNSLNPPSPILISEAVIVEFSERAGSPMFFSVNTDKVDLLRVASSPLSISSSSESDSSSHYLINQCKASNELLDAFQHFVLNRMGNEMLVDTAIGVASEKGIECVRCAAATMDVRFWTGEDGQTIRKKHAVFMNEHNCGTLCETLNVNDEGEDEGDFGSEESVEAIMQLKEALKGTNEDDLLEALENFGEQFALLVNRLNTAALDDEELIRLIIKRMEESIAQNSDSEQSADSAPSELQSELIHALAILTYRVNNLKRIVKEGGIPIVLKFIKSFNKQDQVLLKNGSHIIWSVREKEPNKVIIRESNGIEILTDCVVKYAYNEDVSILSKVLAVLVQLSLGSTNRERFGAMCKSNASSASSSSSQKQTPHPFVQAMVHLLQQHETLLLRVYRTVATVILNLTSDCTLADEFLLIPKFCKMVETAMHFYLSKEQNSLTRILVSIFQNIAWMPNGSDQIVKEDAHKSLVTLGRNACKAIKEIKSSEQNLTKVEKNLQLEEEVTLVERIFHAIGNMTVSQIAMDALATEDVAKLSLDAISSNLDNSAIVCDATCFLQHISSTDEVLKSIATEDSVKLLLKAAQTFTLNETSVVANVADIFVALSLSDNHKKVLAEKAVLSEIIRLMNVHLMIEEEVSISAIKVIINLTQTDEYQKQIEEAKVVDALLGVLEKKKGKIDRVVMSIVDALVNLAVDQSNSAEIVEAGGIALIISLLNLLIHPTKESLTLQSNTRSASSSSASSSSADRNDADATTNPAQFEITPTFVQMLSQKCFMTLLNIAFDDGNLDQLIDDGVVELLIVFFAEINSKHEIITSSKAAESKEMFWAPSRSTSTALRAALQLLGNLLTENDIRDRIATEKSDLLAELLKIIQIGLKKLELHMNGKMYEDFYSANSSSSSKSSSANVQSSADAMNEKNAEKSVKDEDCDFIASACETLRKLAINPTAKKTLNGLEAVKLMVSVLNTEIKRAEKEGTKLSSRKNDKKSDDEEEEEEEEEEEKEEEEVFIESATAATVNLITKCEDNVVSFMSLDGPRTILKVLKVFGEEHEATAKLATLGLMNIAATPAHARELGKLEVNEVLENIMEVWDGSPAAQHAKSCLARIEKASL